MGLKERVGLPVIMIMSKKKLRRKWFFLLFYSSFLLYYVRCFLIYTKQYFIADYLEVQEQWH